MALESGPCQITIVLTGKIFHMHRALPTITIFDFSAKRNAWGKPKSVFVYQLGSELPDVSMNAEVKVAMARRSRFTFFPNDLSFFNCFTVLDVYITKMCAEC